MSLAEQVTELHWDLGGLAYEMAIRDHFRLDVLVRRAAVLQERDAELAEVERMLRMQEDERRGDLPGMLGAPQPGRAVLLAVRRDADGARAEAAPLPWTRRRARHRRRASRSDARSAARRWAGDQRYCLACGARVGARSPHLEPLLRSVPARAYEPTPRVMPAYRRPLPRTAGPRPAPRLAA